MALKKLKEWFDNLLDKKYKKQFMQALEEANEIVNRETSDPDEEGILVGLVNDDSSVTERRLTRTNFEAGFHETIFNNLSFAEKMALLMWLEGYFAKKDHREEAYFLLNDDENKRLVTVKDGNFIFNIPPFIFDNEFMLPYDYANLIVNMCARAKLIDRYMKFEKTGKLEEFDEKTLKSLKYEILRPKSYYQGISDKVNAFGTLKECRTKEEQLEAESRIVPLTQPEKEELALYLLQPYLNVQKNELKVLDEFAERNTIYLSEDSEYNAYKQDLEYTMALEEEFLKDYANGKNRTDLFFELLEKQTLSEDKTTEKNQ